MIGKGDFIEKDKKKASKEANSTTKQKATKQERTNQEQMAPGPTKALFEQSQHMKSEAEKVKGSGEVKYYGHLKPQQPTNIKPDVTLAKAAKKTSPSFMGKSATELQEQKPMPLKKGALLAGSTATEFAAGVVGVGESLARENPITQKVAPNAGGVPDIMGAAISSGIESYEAGKLKASKEAKFLAEHPAYTAGAAVGEALLSIVTGRAIEKAGGAMAKAGEAISESHSTTGKVLTKVGDILGPKVKVKKLTEVEGKVGIEPTEEGIGFTRNLKAKFKIEKIPKRKAEKMNFAPKGSQPLSVGGDVLTEVKRPTGGILSKAHEEIFAPEELSELVRPKGAKAAQIGKSKITFEFTNPLEGPSGVAEHITGARASRTFTKGGTKLESRLEHAGMPSMREPEFGLETGERIAKGSLWEQPFEHKANIKSPLEITQIGGKSATREAVSSTKLARKGLRTSEVIGEERGRIGGVKSYTGPENLKFKMKPTEITASVESKLIGPEERQVGKLGRMSNKEFFSMPEHKFTPPDVGELTGTKGLVGGLKEAGEEVKLKKFEPLFFQGRASKRLFIPRTDLFKHTKPKATKQATKPAKKGTQAPLGGLSTRNLLGGGLAGHFKYKPTPPGLGLNTRNLLGKGLEGLSTGKSTKGSGRARSKLVDELIENLKKGSSSSGGTTSKPKIDIKIDNVIKNKIDQDIISIPDTGQATKPKPIPIPITVPIPKPKPKPKPVPEPITIPIHKPKPKPKPIPITVPITTPTTEIVVPPVTTPTPTIKTPTTQIVVSPPTPKTPPSPAITTPTPMIQIVTPPITTPTTPEAPLKPPRPPKLPKGPLGPFPFGKPPNGGWLIGPGATGKRYWERVYKVGDPLKLIATPKKAKRRKVRKVKKKKRKKKR